MSSTSNDRYYTDEEIIDLIENIGDSTHSYFWVADKVRERFYQKDKQREQMRKACAFMCASAQQEEIKDV